MKPLLLLRPEPGLSDSRSRARALGLTVMSQPLFAIECIDAAMPDGRFDAVVLTSANAVRCGSEILSRCRSLPAYAVGEATAKALRACGIDPVHVGSGGVEGMALPHGRLLHVTGEVHRPLPADAIAVPVYRSVATDTGLPPLSGMVIAVHSPRAGERLSDLAGADRGEAVVAAISAAAAAACGDGWQAIHAAPSPDDTALLALAAMLCQSPDP